MMTRVRDFVESVVLIPHSGNHDHDLLRQFVRELQAGKCEHQSQGPCLRREKVEGVCKVFTVSS